MLIYLYILKNTPADLARLIIFNLLQKNPYMNDLILMIWPILIFLWQEKLCQQLVAICWKSAADKE